MPRRIVASATLFTPMISAAVRRSVLWAFALERVETPYNSPMNACRLSGRVEDDLTITVRVPTGSPIGAQAEVIVLFSDDAPAARRWENDPLHRFLHDLKTRPRRISTWREEQDEVRKSREEWD